MSTHSGNYMCMCIVDTFLHMHENIHSICNMMCTRVPVVLFMKHRCRRCLNLQYLQVLQDMHMSSTGTLPCHANMLHPHGKPR